VEAPPREASTVFASRRLIDIGGRRRTCIAPARASQTVILMAGGGAFYIDGRSYNRRCSKHKSCSYGQGARVSDPGDQRRNRRQNVSDLQSSSKTRDEGSVSTGRASVGRHIHSGLPTCIPKDVAGLIFSNSSNRVGRLVNGKPGLIGNDRAADTFDVSMAHRQRPCANHAKMTLSTDSA